MDAEIFRTLFAADPPKDLEWVNTGDPPFDMYEVRGRIEQVNRAVERLFSFLESCTTELQRNQLLQNGMVLVDKLAENCKAYRARSTSSTQVLEMLNSAFFLQTSVKAKIDECKLNQIIREERQFPFTWADNLADEEFKCDCNDCLICKFPPLPVGEDDIVEDVMANELGDTQDKNHQTSNENAKAVDNTATKQVDDTVVTLDKTEQEVVDNIDSKQMGSLAGGKVDKDQVPWVSDPNSTEGQGEQVKTDKKSNGSRSQNGGTSQRHSERGSEKGRGRTYEGHETARS
ncbi:hypothetical protein F4779DRAFT_621631 [Xylariaceae sp. FL0662B]|nr:hypothetical protein F4779DRAFT_621631 [Xylariaceae sp. FL0662B]